MISDFTDSSVRHCFKKVDNRLDNDRSALLWHHYRHAVVYNWGSRELVQQLLPESFTGGEEGYDTFSDWEIL
jgi:hypothetical protein